MNNLANKDINRIEQQIISLKDTSKQDAKIFETQLKEMVVLSEKKKLVLEQQNGQVQKRNQGNNVLDMQSPHQDPGNILGNCQNSKNLAFEKLTNPKQISEFQRKQEDDFKKLVIATKIDDFSVLIDNFLRIEEENFNEFRFINETNFEIQELEMQIAQLREDRSLLLSEVTENEQKHQQIALKAENEKQTLISQREKISQLNEDAENKLKEILKEVCNIFYNIGAENLLEKSVLKNEFMRIENFPEILKIIETRFLEIIFAYSTIMSNVI